MEICWRLCYTAFNTTQKRVISVKKHDIFISYRRDGGEFTAKMLRDRLTELGYRVFFDVETLRSGNFNTMLYEAIDQCDDFLLILSPEALDRCVHPDDWVRREIEYALMKGKNVVPVLLRGFVFPEELPETLQELPYRNGLEANTQFFDAFMETLRKFLKSKPPLSRRILQNSLFRKTLPFLLAIVIVSGLALGIGITIDSWNAQYPRTVAEQNLTKEVIYYVGRNLTYFDILADAKADALSAARRYQQTGERPELYDAFAVSLNTLNNTDLTSAAPSETFLNQLAESPFDSAEFTAIHQELLQFRQSCLEELNYIRQLFEPGFYLAESQKLETVDNYEAYLENETQAYAYAANRMLLPITDHDALDLFWEDILPELERIPLRAANWNTDGAALEAAIDECVNNMENAIHNLEKILGNATVVVGQEREKLIAAYETMGYTREDAEKIVELVLLGYNGEQSKLIVALEKQGYTQDQTLAIYDYTQQGFTLERAQVLVDYESLDLEEEEAWAEDYYITHGYSKEAAAERAAQYMELEQKQYEFRLQMCGLTTDDENTLWYKMIRLRNAMLYTEAVECLELYAALKEESDPLVYAYLVSVVAQISQIPDTGIDYGAVVVAYTYPDHPVLQIGDIVIAVNGEPCRTGDDFVRMRSALTGTDYTVTVMRWNGEILEQLDLELSTLMPLVEWLSLAMPE